MRKPQIRTASPVLKQVFMEMHLQGVTQNAIAECLNSTQSRVSEWSQGKVEPGVMTVEAICRRLGYRLALEPIEERKRA
ncbi:helix-turn-helix domain-containing protein [Mesorhizobium sp. M0618]|uniref:helix-turn-helix domain-containing protein n=1 Tax=Mesorhizobium sp. M0618 TaxID=2956972 RepID=UPI003338C1F7